MAVEHVTKCICYYYYYFFLLLLHYSFGVINVHQYSTSETLAFRRSKKPGYFVCVIYT